jgi:hypothetical protein
LEINTEGSSTFVNTGSHNAASSGSNIAIDRADITG